MSTKKMATKNQLATLSQNGMHLNKMIWNVIMVTSAWSWWWVKNKKKFLNTSNKIGHQYTNTRKWNFFVCSTFKTAFFIFTFSNKNHHITALLQHCFAMCIGCNYDIANITLQFATIERERERKVKLLIFNKNMVILLRWNCHGKKARPNTETHSHGIHRWWKKMISKKFESHTHHHERRIWCKTMLCFECTKRNGSTSRKSQKQQHRKTVYSNLILFIEMF